VINEMRGSSDWVDPLINWGPALDAAHFNELQAVREPLVTWPATEFDPTDTDCFSAGDDLWIWQPAVGAVRFRVDAPSVDAYPWPGAEHARFREIVTRSWLPAIYPLWGRQVLHASAVHCAGTGATVAFTGPTHAGKSTTAYGLQRAFGWQALSDDTLAFSHNGTSVRLHPLPNGTRLRPASAGFFGEDPAGVRIPWPGGAPFLSAIYVLEGDESHPVVSAFERLRASDALPLLLQQAFTFSLQIPKYNQQLIRDYLALVSVVPTFRLRYRRSFDVAAELYSAIRDHLAHEAGVICSADQPV
jgi:hypothetical protein